MAKEVLSASKQNGWYPYGVAFLFFEMCIAILVSGYSPVLSLTGSRLFFGQ